MLKIWAKKTFVIFRPQKFNKKSIGFLNIYNSYTHLSKIRLT